MDANERAELVQYLDFYVDQLSETFLSAARELALEPRNRSARQLVATSAIELQRLLDIRNNLRN